MPRRKPDGRKQYWVKQGQDKGEKRLHEGIRVCTHLSLHLYELLLKAIPAGVVDHAWIYDPVLATLDLMCSESRCK